MQKRQRIIARHNTFGPVTASTRAVGLSSKGSVHGQKTSPSQQRAKMGRALMMAGLVIAAAGVFANAHAQLPAAQTANGVEYVSGGIGKDESDAFKAAKSKYPLSLTFAATSPGSSATPYAAEVQVEIKDESGNTVLSIPSAGPYVLVDLEPGQYEINATFEGDTQTATVMVVGDGSADLRLAWTRPASGAD